MQRLLGLEESPRLLLGEASPQGSSQTENETANDCGCEKDGVSEKNDWFGAGDESDSDDECAVQHGRCWD